MRNFDLQPEPPPPQGIVRPVRLEYDDQGGMDCLTPAWRLVDASNTTRLVVDTREFGYMEVCPTSPKNKLAKQAAEKLATAILQLVNSETMTDQLPIHKEQDETGKE